MAKKAIPQQKNTQIFNYLYIGTFALMPFMFKFFESSMQDPGLYPRHVLLAVAVIIGGIALFTVKSKPLPFRLTLAAISFFVLWHFAGYSSAIAKTEFWASFGRSSLMLGFLLLTFQLLRNELLSFKSIILGVVVFAAISALSLVPDFFKLLDKGNKDVTTIYQVRGLFTHKNFAASALLMCIPFLYLGTRSSNKTWRIIAIGTLALAIFEIVVLRTRGVWIGFFAGVSATVVLQVLSKQKERGQLKLIAMGTGIFALLLAGVFLMSDNSEKILNRGNIDIRFIYWETCIEMVKEQPITGVGAGNWKINFPKYGLDGTNQSVMEGETNISRPHNDMLWVLAEMGIPAWIALAVFQLFLLFISVKLLNHTDGEKRNYAMASIFALVAFAGYGLGEFPIERTIMVALLILLASETLRLGEEEGILKKPLFTLSPKIVNALIITLAVLGLWIGKARIDGEKNAKKAVDGYLDRKPADMLTYGEEAKNRFFSVDIYNTPMSYFTGLGYLAQQKFVEAEREFKDALEVNPYHINTLRQLGDTYKFQKKYDQAIEQYDKSLAISSQFFYVNLSKVEIYLYQNNTPEALKSLNLVSHKTTYPKYQQVGTEVLLRIAKLDAFPDQPELHNIAQRYKNDPATLWVQYLAWKKQIMTGA